MVSFWPFKGDDTSAASFEKVLSQLSTKINKSSAQQDRLRSQQRRLKALWTLYTTFAYILIAAILTLVTGWDRWSYGEYTAVAGGPVIIYGARTVLDAYYNYRIANNHDHLNDLNKQRDEAIERLKKATKYNSTQQLLDKYGGVTPPKKGQSSPQVKGKRLSDVDAHRKSTTPQPSRTGFAPPPTANIPNRQLSPGPVPPQNFPGSAVQSPGDHSPQSVPSAGAGEEFAPNAFSTPAVPPPVQRATTQYANRESKWYDRVLDVVLGEDETSAKNRTALICQNCRLVNGQAPPGARTLEDVGRWRCSACHAMNGIESEEKKMLQQISQPESLGSPVSPISPVSAATASENDDGLENEKG